MRIKKQNLENNQKNPCRLQEIIAELETLYSELYDINLYIYKSESDKTIIDIKYYSKKSLEPSFREKVTDKAPMLHCKISHPPTLSEGEKFDINWETQMQ